MENTINQAFSEVYDIIIHMKKYLVNKIPIDFLKMIEQNRDIQYKVEIDYNKNINEQILLQDTRAILSLIYRDYLCSPEERAKIIKNDKIELAREEEKTKEMYNLYDIFKKKNTNKEQIITENIENNIDISNENVQIIKYEKSFIKKIINNILKFLHIR